MNPVSMSRESIAAPSTLRALVVGDDAGYRRRAEQVIGEVGSVSFAVMPPTDPVDVVDLAERERAAVLVLDATGCEAQVTAVVRALAERVPQIGVVVVCEHLTEPARELRALPKWGWMRDLREAVQRAAIDGNPLGRPRALAANGRRDLRAISAPRVNRR
jgi:hypothetical protein